MYRPGADVLEADEPRRRLPVRETLLTACLVVSFICTVTLAITVGSRTEQRDDYRRDARRAEQRALCYAAERDQAENDRIIYGRALRGVVRYWAAC